MLTEHIFLCSFVAFMYLSQVFYNLFIEIVDYVPSIFEL